MSLVVSDESISPDHYQEGHQATAPRPATNRAKRPPARQTLPRRRFPNTEVRRAAGILPATASPPGIFIAEPARLHNAQRSTRAVTRRRKTPRASGIKLSSGDFAAAGRLGDRSERASRFTPPTAKVAADMDSRSRRPGDAAVRAMQRDRGERNRARKASYRSRRENESTCSR